jgi:hypothetical protein
MRTDPDKIMAGVFRCATGRDVVRHCPAVSGRPGTAQAFRPVFLESGKGVQARPGV